jgi:hypothetical protein
MEKEELRHLLEQLQTEIKNTESVDEKGRDLLRDLDTDIHDLLARGGGEPLQPNPSTFKQLEDGINHFEVTHPTLTLMMTKLSTILSTAGI